MITFGAVGCAVDEDSVEGGAVFRRRRCINDMRGYGVARARLYRLHRIALVRARRGIPALAQRIRHGLDVTPVITVLAETPRHDSAQFIFLHNAVKFERDKLRRVPCPEKAVRGIEVVLPASFPVRDTVLECDLPGSSDIRIGTPGTEGMLTGTRAVLGRGTAVTVLGAAA
jgi:hypothetical protein